MKSLQMKVASMLFVASIMNAITLGNLYSKVKVFKADETNEINKENDLDEVKDYGKF